MIYAFCNKKGGVGKTTLALNFAAFLAKKGQKILVIDADEQGSALDCSLARQEAPILTTIGLPRANLHEQIKTLKTGYNSVIIDTPAGDSDITESAMTAANVVIIPVQASCLDSWATHDIIKTAEKIKIFNKKLKCFFVINRQIKNTFLARGIKDCLVDYSATILDSQVTGRVTYAETFARGHSVFDDVKNTVAINEISELSEEILRRSK